MKTVYRRVTSLKPGDVARVRGLQWDPQRTAPIALVDLLSDGVPTGVQRYIVAGEGVRVGQTLLCDPKRTNLVPNHRTLRGRVPVGMTVYDRASPDRGKATWVKVAGSSARVQRHEEETRRTLVKRPSGEVRWRSSACRVSLGRVGAQDHRLEKVGKAGTNRRRGIRPTVRGCAMNPVDHPHGGRTKGGRHDVTPWAKIAKGQPTRPRRKALGWIVTTARQARREHRATS